MVLGYFRTPYVKGRKRGRHLRLYVVHYVAHYWDGQTGECQDSDVVRSGFNFSILVAELRDMGEGKDSRYSDEVITKSPGRRYVSLMGAQGNENEKMTNGSISEKISDSVW